MTDHYSTLGVEKVADKATIKRAYRKRASKAHPDKANGDAKLMAALNTAYACLSDDTKRARYDETGNDGNGPTPEDEARNVLMQAINAAIEDSGNVVLTASKLLRGKLHEVTTGKNAAVREIGKLRAMRKTVQAKGKLNLFHMVIDQRLAAAEAREKLMTQGIGYLTEAITMLTDYECHDVGTDLHAEMEALLGRKSASLFG